MIMVRRNELACRDGWSRSLWQPATNMGSEGEPPFQPPPGSGPQPATSPQSLRALLERDAAVAAELVGEDVLLSEARIIAERPNVVEVPDRPSPTGGFDPRTAIFRAREAFRDRARANAAAARRANAAEPTGTVGEPEATHFASDPDTLELAEALEPVSEPQAPEVAHATAVITSPVPQMNSWNDSEPTIAGVRLSAVAALAAGDLVETAVGPTLDPTGEVPAAQESLATLESTDTATGAIPEVQEWSLPLADPMAEVEHTLPGWFRTDLPRICRACRDFRPSAEGERGWCGNVWAFTHRRLVHGSDMAPCHSTIGDWWTPVDDVWLVAADVSAHGRSTPLLDRFLGEDRARRRRS